MKDEATNPMRSQYSGRLPHHLQTQLDDLSIDDVKKTMRNASVCLPL